MLLTFEIFGSARNHGKKFLKLCQTSFSGSVHWFPAHTMQYQRIILYYYAETKEMISESLDLKRVVYISDQNFFSLQSITICTRFENVGPIFY